MSLSCVLNFLDGPQSVDGMITIMTNNYPERLDGALTREGRCDRKWELHLCTLDQCLDMFDTFYPTAPSDIRIN